MNNIIYLQNDPILVELNDSIDKRSAKRMIAFKYFNNDINLLNDYLKDKDNSENPAGTVCCCRGTGGRCPSSGRTKRARRTSRSLSRAM